MGVISPLSSILGPRAARGRWPARSVWHAGGAVDHQAQGAGQLGSQPARHMDGLFDALFGQWTLFISLCVHASLADA